MLITGTVTNVCCESSARDAMMTNFKTIMVSDGNAAMTQEEHEAALTAFYNIFGDVMDTDMIIAALARGGAAKAHRRADCGFTWAPAVARARGQAGR